MFRTGLILVLSVSLGGCATSWRAQFIAPAQYGALSSRAPFLKAHMRDGTVYVLERWAVREDRTISGEGLHYDLSRTQRVAGTYSLPFDDVALVETNQPESVVHSGLIVMAVVTGLSLAASAVCLTTPKACFGSCPTFYARPDGPILAEGFSQSIARTLEATDVDPFTTSEGGAVSVWMKNEAPETHVVKSLRLLSVPLGDARRVVRGGERFYPVKEELAPTWCRAPSGDCTAAVAAEDAAQYLSLTSPEDLAALETVELAFDRVPEGRLGLVLRARASLVETYVFYQLLAYLGLAADDWFLQLEKGGALGKRLIDGVIGPLGRIEVAVQRGRGWREVGTFGEVGPLAFDEAVLPLEAPADGPLRVRLTMARGAWKVDHVSLAALGPEVAATALTPQQVESQGTLRPQVKADLETKRAPLVTTAGDVYRFDFVAPKGRQALFLESTGYYYEWQRDSWLKEESREAFLDAVWNPEVFLKRIAPGYKALEPQVEALFWQSRVEAK